MVELLTSSGQSTLLSGRIMAQRRFLSARQGAFRVLNVRSLLTHSRVLVQISAEVTKPLEDRKFDGIFTITTELSPIASPAFEVGRYWTIADPDTSNFTS
jgi:exosome complex component RRP45